MTQARSTRVASRLYGTGALLALSVTLVTACGSDDAVKEAPRAPDAEDGNAGGGGSATAERSPLYAIATAVSDDSSSNTYVKLFSKFESELDLGTAREFPGWSDISVVGRYLLVSSGEEPKVTRFLIDDHDELVEDGTISFANYTDDGNLYDQTLVSETQALLLGQSEYVLWNPSTLEITGTIPYPDLPERESIVPGFYLDSGAVVRGNRLYSTAPWGNFDDLQILPDSRIVVIDLDEHQVVDVLTVPCPDIDVADADDDGNLYFSNWVYSPGSTLLEGGAKACAVRILAGEEKLDDWRLSFDEVTGREGAVLGYLGEGRWVFSSFMNDVAEYDPNEDWFDWLFGDTWALHSIDLPTLTATKIDGLPRNGGGYFRSRFDGLTHVLIPGDSYTTTAVWAIDSGGVATQKLHTDGWSTRLYKMR